MRRTRTHTHTIAITVVIVMGLLGLAGCDSNQPATAPPPVPTSTSTSTTAPPDDDNGPPALPGPARDKTAAGAKAFVRYYVELLNHSVTHNSIIGMRAAQAPGCTVCERFVSSIRKNARNGGSQTGGEWTVKATSVIGDLDRPIVVTRVIVSPGQVVARSGEAPRTIQRHSSTFQFMLTRWRELSWRVRDVRDV